MGAGRGPENRWGSFPWAFDSPRLRHAPVAQRPELRTLNPTVAGSTPARRTHRAFGYG